MAAPDLACRSQASVVAAHGGEISYSNTLGGGATFTLTLPRDGKPDEDEEEDDVDTDVGHDADAEQVPSE